MQQEIVRITSSTTAAGKYNGKSLFQSDASFNIQVGADQGQTIGVTFKDLSSSGSSTFAAADGTSIDWKSVVNGGASGMSIGGGVGSAKMATNLRDISGAIDFIANVRANSGAQSKRLKMTGESLATYESNIRSAESYIRDVDVAQESTKLANYQIKLNASSAMLAQANQLPSSVLQLLG
jgi:flagellin